MHSTLPEYDSVRGGRTRYAGGGVGELGKSSDDMNSSIGVAQVRPTRPASHHGFLRVHGSCAGGLISPCKGVGLYRDL